MMFRTQSKQALAWTEKSMGIIQRIVYFMSNREDQSRLDPTTAVFSVAILLSNMNKKLCGGSRITERALLANQGLNLEKSTSIIRNDEPPPLSLSQGNRVSNRVPGRIRQYSDNHAYILFKVQYGYFIIPEGAAIQSNLPIRNSSRRRLHRLLRNIQCAFGCLYRS